MSRGEQKPGERCNVASRSTEAAACASHRACAVIDLCLLPRCSDDDSRLLWLPYSAKLADEAFDGVVSAAETIAVDQVLPDGHGIALPAQSQFDDFPQGFAVADTLLGRWQLKGCFSEKSLIKVGGHLPSWAGFAPPGFGGHLYGRFWPPPARRIGRYSLGLQIIAGRFPAYTGGLLDSPQGPA